MKVCIPQVRAHLGDKEKNIGTIERIAGEAGADLLVFPELFLTGYVVRDDMRILSEPLSGQSCTRISEIAKDTGAVIIFGMAEKDARRRGIIYNTAVIAPPSGELHSYRKMFLANFGPFEERTYFAPGRRLDLIDTHVGRIGLQVCFDIFFPELSRLLALSGAEIIVCISASPSATREFFQRVLPARAIENTAFVLFSNHVGTQRDIVFWGGGEIIGPRGDVLAQGTLFEECLVEAEISLSSLEVARHYRPTIKEARHEVLERLVREMKEGSEALRDR
ncbi:MAG: carbon-nitrogen hydrolase family protein [Candidatus Thermoplasmatota archaeon]